MNGRRHLRSRLAAVMLLAAVATGAPAQEVASAPDVAPASPLSLEDAIRVAVAASPDVAAAQAALSAARAGVAVAGQRPNPELALEEARETPHDAATLTVPLELGGKRGRRVDVAMASAQVAEADLARAELDVRQRVRRAYATVLGGEREAALRRQQQELARRVRDAAQQRFDLGEAPRLETVESALLLEQASVDAEAAEAATIGARAALDTLLGRPVDAPLALAPASPTAVLPPVPDLTAQALQTSGELRALEREVAAQGARVALARAQGVPDWNVSGAVTHDSPPEFDWGWRFGLALVVPLLHGPRAGIEVEQHTLEQRQAELEAARRRVTGEVVRTRALAEAAAATAQRYASEVLPRTEEVERMAEDSYRSGETNLTSFLQAVVAARETRLRAIQAEIDLQSALADLEQALGAPLP